MSSANFSESQLQEAVNISIVDFIKDSTGDKLLPLIPSLILEKDLGWDTGFDIKQLAKKATDGANFFIQYKLSTYQTRSNSNEWKYWNKKYFRFKIPHNKKDFHQWNALKDLANKQYPVYYATNATIKFKELESDYKSDLLLGKTPFLDVRDIKKKHFYVTFTNSSNYFYLHSEIEEVDQLTFSSILKSLQNIKGGSMYEQSIKLIKFINQTNPSTFNIKEIEEFVEKKISYINTNLKKKLDELFLDDFLDDLLDDFLDVTRKELKGELINELALNLNQYLSTFKNEFKKGFKDEFIDEFLDTYDEFIDDFHDSETNPYIDEYRQENQELKRIFKNKFKLTFKNNFRNVFQDNFNSTTIEDNIYIQIKGLIYQSILSSYFRQNLNLNMYWLSTK